MVKLDTMANRVAHFSPETPEPLETNTPDQFLIRSSNLLHSNSLRAVFRNRFEPSPIFQGHVKKLSQKFSAKRTPSYTNSDQFYHRKPLNFKHDCQLCKSPVCTIDASLYLYHNQRSGLYIQFL